MAKTDTAERATLSWTLDAPPAGVFRAWTDPDHLRYGGVTTTPSSPSRPTYQARPTRAEAWRQQHGDQRDHGLRRTGIYREIVPDTRAHVFAWGATDG